MTQIPFEPINPAEQAQANPLPGLFPTDREEYAVYEKELPSQRVVCFYYQKKTFIENGTAYITYKLVRAPPLDCSCSPMNVNDILECVLCFSLMCRFFHSVTCQVCGNVVCSGCAQGIFVEHVPIVICAPCAEKLTAGFIKRACMKINSFIWKK